MPFFNSSYFYNYSKSDEYSLDFFHHFSNKINKTDKNYEAFSIIINQQRNLKNPIILLESPNNTKFVSSTKENDLRLNEKVYNEKENFKSITNYYHKIKMESLLNLIRTIFVCVVLTVAALSFSKDSNELVLIPMERIFKTVNKIASNPLSARNEALINQKGKKKELETIAIENSLIKIGLKKK